MKRPAPDELKAILKHRKEWELRSLRFWAMGWIAELDMKNRQFTLVSDRGYIDVYERIDGKGNPLLPPGDQRIRITPKQVRALIENALRDNVE